jgi:DNA-binding CsgD family transcriptional regulator
MAFPGSVPRENDSFITNHKHLTMREQEVLALIGRGLSLPEIARQIHRSPKTVAAHRLRLGKKLNLHNRVDLARFAIQCGLAPLYGHTQPQPADWDAGSLASFPNLNTQIGGSQQPEPDQEKFLPGCMYLVGELLGVSCAFVADFADRGLTRPRLRAVWCRNGWTSAGEHGSLDALCATTIREGVLSCPNDLPRRFPGIEMPTGWTANSYFGTTITDPAGQPLGVVGLLDEQEIDTSPGIRMLLEVVASRVAAELSPVTSST